MKNLIKLCVVFTFYATMASATPEEKPPVVTSGDGDNGWLIPVIIVVGGILIATNRKPETSNCDTISDQTIYGADGKLTIVTETDTCD